MEILLLLLLAFIVWQVGSAAGGFKKTTVISERRCPPHKWRFEDIKDHDGVVHATKVICEHCGPMNKSSPPERMDY